MNSPKFKYFDNVLENAEFTDIPCEICGSQKNCLEGLYFECDDINSACIDCLSKGKIKVNITEFIKERIIAHLKENNKNEDEIERKVKMLVDELERTPPVPWIQYNDWPICCNDFTKYLGEWGKEDIIRNSHDKNEKEHLISILDDFSKSRIDNLDCFWDEIGDDVAIFVFKCIYCSKLIAVWQSY